MFRAQSSKIQGVPHLSPREQQVLDLLSQGCSNKEIAERLGIAAPTVSQYVHALFFKLGVNNRTKIAVWVVQRRSK